MSTRPANKLCSSEVDRWLQRLKLSQYAPNFHQNKLTNLKQCQRLTRQTLELMGVTLPGHITRLERAILKLRSDRSSNRMSNSLEDLHAELERDSVTASSSFYYRFGEVIDMTSLPRSESDPELCGPTALHEDFSPNSSDYYDMLSEFISPVNNNIQTNGDYEFLDPPAPPPPVTPKQSSSEETELDPLTYQPIVFTRNTHAPIPSPRHPVNDSRSADLNQPRTYDELTRQIQMSNSQHSTTIAAMYSMINEELIEKVGVVRSPEKGEYDQLTAVSAIPIVHPNTPLLSPPVQAKGLRPEILAAIGLKDPSSDSPPPPPQVPTPAPRRSPSNPSTHRVSPKLPPRFNSQNALFNSKMSAPLPMIKTTSPGVPTLPSSSLISPPTRHMSVNTGSLKREQTEFIPDPTSPLDTIPNPDYISTDSLELIRSSTSYMPMRPAPRPPFFNDVLGDDHVISSSSSEDESSNVVTELPPPTKMVSSLPADPNLVPNHLKRFNTEVVNPSSTAVCLNLTLILFLYIVGCDRQTEQSKDCC